MSLRVHPDEIVELSSNGLLDKHPSWSRVPVGEIAEIRNGFAFKSKRFNSEGRGTPLIRIRDVGKSHSETYYEGEFDDEYWVESGDLIIGMDGDFRVARWRGPRSLLNQRVCRLRVTSNLYDDRFLEYVLQGYLDAIHEHTSSVTVKHLSSKTIAQIPVPFPPLDEQVKIVEAVDEQFSRLDAALLSLRAAEQRLQQLRRSILRSVSLGTIAPEGISISEGIEKRVDEVATVQLGRQRSPEHHSGDHMRPYLRAANITWEGISLDDVKKMNFPPEDFERFRLHPGDILLNEASGSADEVGKSAIWQGQMSDACFQNTLLRVVPHDNMDLRYLWLLLRDAAANGGFARVARGVNILHLGKAGLAAWPVVVRPIDEQRLIAEEAERQLSIVEATESAMDQALSKSQALRKSILAAAFSGRLVGGSWASAGNLVPSDVYLHGRDAGAEEEGVAIE